MGYFLNVKGLRGDMARFPARWLAAVVAAVALTWGGSLAAGDARVPPASTVAAAKPLPAAELVPPEPPKVPPYISAPVEKDADGNQIDDRIDAKLAQAAGLAARGDQAEALALQGELVRVELIFSAPITQAQLAAFGETGGVVEYIFKSVSYGWYGVLPAKLVPRLPQVMGASLVAVVQESAMYAFLNEATQTGRARPVWRTGFAGSAGGFRGSVTTTIAVLDTGVDETHTDLAGRRAFWKDYVTTTNTSPTDPNGHGTHVSGMATGTGTAGATDPTTCRYSDSSGSSVHLPAGNAAWNTTAYWNGGGTGTLGVYRRVDGSSGAVTPVTTVQGTSPLLLSATVAAQAGMDYFALLDNVASPYVMVNTVPNTALGDGFNDFQGVAPNCRWAGGRVLDTSGSGWTTWIEAGIDDMVTNRQTYGIKVINMSLGGGEDSGMRDKVNTAVANGICLVVANGNSGGGATPGDPALAAKAITIAAANDANELTYYTTGGTRGSGASQDLKPDLMAPGGSAYRSMIISADSNTDDSEDESFADRRLNDYANLQGTSMATPFAAGATALVIQAVEQAGHVWDFTSDVSPLLVKMLLCATATESNTPREAQFGYDPLLGRATNPKDIYEGYGMLNTDAAIEAAVQQHVPGSSWTGSTTGVATDRRAWGRYANLEAGDAIELTLNVPTTGDFDLYIYSSTPDSKGNPVILTSSTNAGNGVGESISLVASAKQTVRIVVKRVAGSGTWSVEEPLSPTVAVGLSKNDVYENAGPAAVVATVKRTNASLINALTIGITNSAPTKATMPSEVTIAAGQDSIMFSIDILDNDILDGEQNVRITPVANGYRALAANLRVLDYEALAVDVVASDVDESLGYQATSGTVTRANTDNQAALTVSLLSDDTTSVTVPATVTIPAGSAFTSFEVNVINNSVIEADRTVVITASANGYVPGADTIRVIDDDRQVPTVAVKLRLNPALYAGAADYSTAGVRVKENAGSSADWADVPVQGEVILTPYNVSTSDPLVVNLTNSLPDKCTVPDQVTIAADATTATFPVSILDDHLLDRARSVELGARVPLWEVRAIEHRTVAASFVVEDYETLTLTLVPDEVPEVPLGRAPFAIVTRSNTDNLGLALVVAVTSSDLHKVIVPTTVTIPANEASVAFDLQLVDDGINAGNRYVRITVAATGYESVAPGLPLKPSWVKFLKILDSNQELATYLLAETQTSAGEGSGDARRVSGLLIFQVDAEDGSLVPIGMVQYWTAGTARRYRLTTELSYLTDHQLSSADGTVAYSLMASDGTAFQVWMAAGRKARTDLGGTVARDVPLTLSGVALEDSGFRGVRSHVAVSDLALRLDLAGTRRANTQGLTTVDVVRDLIRKLEGQGYEAE